jgi:hypothetical protein
MNRKSLPSWAFWGLWIAGFIFVISQPWLSK